MDAESQDAHSTVMRKTHECIWEFFELFFWAARLDLVFFLRKFANKQIDVTKSFGWGNDAKHVLTYGFALYYSKNKLGSDCCGY